MFTKERNNIEFSLKIWRQLLCNLSTSPSKSTSFSHVVLLNWEPVSLCKCSYYRKWVSALSFSVIKFIWLSCFTLRLHISHRGSCNKYLKEVKDNVHWTVCPGIQINETNECWSFSVFDVSLKSGTCAFMMMCVCMSVCVWFQACFFRSIAIENLVTILSQEP